MLPVVKIACLSSAVTPWLDFMNQALVKQITGTTCVPRVSTSRARPIIFWSMFQNFAACRPVVFTFNLNLGGSFLPRLATPWGGRSSWFP